MFVLNCDRVRALIRLHRTTAQVTNLRYRTHSTGTSIRATYQHTAVHNVARGLVPRHKQGLSP